ncbi:hypothetical protein [Halobacillus massiliensis]|uniref:hypothetical protein n=1 Tax=Halobacillus massiliensis TaxID=1926286 RepID=UPI0009E29142|nr:hypothetical protein [Halobacillus massiliensis]
MEPPAETTWPPGLNDFIWGRETIYWADSNAPYDKYADGTPVKPFNSLQDAINAATTSPYAVANGMKARLIILIASDSRFDENIIIPPARHLQLLGLGPCVLGDGAGEFFASTTPRNITIQSNPAKEAYYPNSARPVTVIGTFDNGTSISTHTNYTNGAIISGNVTFQNTNPSPGDDSTLIEFQLLNARVQGSVRADPVHPHRGTTNTYMYHSRVNTVNNPWIRIQRMVDCRSDGTMTISGYANIENCWIRGNVTANAGNILDPGDIPPIGVFNTQFDRPITWTFNDPVPANRVLYIDPESNYYFNLSGSAISGGTKQVLFDLA